MTDSSINSVLQTARPHETRLVLGQWLRLTRQRQGLTQPLLASKAGVSAMTISRLEREGQGGVDNLLRILQALGELDSFDSHLKEELRKASLPLDLAALSKSVRLRQRVRLPKRPGTTT